MQTLHTSQYMLTLTSYTMRLPVYISINLIQEVTTEVDLQTQWEEGGVEYQSACLKTLIRTRNHTFEVAETPEEVYRLMLSKAEELR